MKKLSFLFVAAIALLSFKAVESYIWTADSAHSRLGFTVNHLGIADFNGNFSAFESKITSSKPDFSDATVELSADINSITTGIEQRDGHLKSADFFDAEKFPKLTFKSSSFKKDKGNKYKVTGELSMHGVTKTVELDASLTGATTHPISKKEMTGFKVTGKIKRSDFAIGGSMPAPMLGDEVTLLADLEFIKD